jgi:hypothetical protein
VFVIAITLATNTGATTTMIPAPFLAFNGRLQAWSATPCLGSAAPARPVGAKLPVSKWAWGVIVGVHGVVSGSVLTAQAMTAVGFSFCVTPRPTGNPWPMQLQYP